MEQIYFIIGREKGLLKMIGPNIHRLADWLVQTSVQPGRNLSAGIFRTSEENISVF
jgi:hypothetical protein